MEIRFSPSDLIELAENGGPSQGHPHVKMVEHKQENGFWWERTCRVVLVPELDGHALGHVAALSLKDGWVDVVFLDENSSPIRVERQSGKVTLVLKAMFWEDWRQIDPVLS